jgi:hypothetical protein
MNASRQSRTVHHRYTSILVAVACLLAAVLLTGCWITGDEEDREDRAAYLRRAEQVAAGSDKIRTGQTAPKGTVENGTVMKAEDDAVQLEGKWTWPSLKVDYTGGRLQNPRIYPIERVGEGWTFTIIKKGAGYTTVSGGTVTLKGTSVTITEDSSDGDSITLTGEVKGDTIVGTVHQSISAKTLSSGVAQGAGEYDGPWTATRVR